MEISKGELDHLCRLARLELGPGEEERLRAELGRILAYMELLRAVDTAGAEAMIHASESPPNLRADAPGRTCDPSTALRGAPQRQGDFFAVPAVVELTRKGDLTARGERPGACGMQTPRRS